MRKKANRIITVFIGLLALFMTVGVVLTGFGIYREQISINSERTRENIRNVAKQIEYEIKADEDDFKIFVDYLIENKDRINVPAGFESWDQAREDFDKAFATQYPGQVFGTDVSFEELSEELKDLYSIYNFEYYRLLFSSYEDSFGLPYVYFIVPTGDGENCAYVIDVEDLVRDDGKYMVLCDTVEESHEDLPVMWKVWEAGIELDEWDVFDNEFGQTYSYYLPLYVNNEKTGLICVDADVLTVNQEIIASTIRSVGLMAIILFLSVLAFAFTFNNLVVKKIAKLQEKVRSYTDSKDPGVADEISQSIKGNDEIGSLASYFANMIRQIDDYIRNIGVMSNELEAEKSKAEAMNELANTDMLTGLKSRTAYINKEVELNGLISSGKIEEFGMILIDLNYLKTINDEYGHEKGDIALINTATLINRVFGSEESYRIGGDEFVVVVTDTDRIEPLIAEFNKLMNEDTRIDRWEHISAAVGYGIYEKGIDNSTADVFAKADAQMYINKKKMKEAQ